MISKYKCFLRREYIIHAVSFFAFLLSSSFLIQMTQFNNTVVIIVSIICFLSAICSLIFQLLFYKKHKDIPKNMRTFVLFYLMIFSGLIITILFLIINSFTLLFAKTSWIAIVMIVSLSTTTFAINYL